ncbi:hypothetical protein IHQ71_04370 [Rhizobium sp. TH2]|uniref:hypothetical protein n=1 Tax=Rhizobium sp. TH2 TaxID=2775403 RepID=UPI0021577C9F|nr:hypothetical protein [Rhizobium sp. TH2]UVC09855.1 hypothetical protein IHQ71_04370 [Rhizobium sp. TH2]
MRRFLFVVLSLTFPITCLAQTAEEQRGRWLECLATAAAKYAAKTRERPEVIVEAAFGKCKQQRLAFLGQMIKESTEFDSTDVSHLTEEQEEMERSGLLAVVLDTRAAQ